jgi:hypothetical protein
MRATCTAHLILLDLITLIIYLRRGTNYGTIYCSIFSTFLLLPLSSAQQFILVQSHTIFFLSGESTWKRNCNSEHTVGRGFVSGVFVLRKDQYDARITMEYLPDTITPTS